MLSLYKFFISSYKFRIYKQRMTVISIQPLQTDPTMSDTWPYFLSVSRKLALLSTKTRSISIPGYTVVAISTSILFFNFFLRLAESIYGGSFGHVGPGKWGWAWGPNYPRKWFL